MTTDTTDTTAAAPAEPVTTTEATVATTEAPHSDKLPGRNSPRRLKRGRHPAPTPGAFGGKRKDNGINFRSSKLISRFA